MKKLFQGAESIVYQDNNEVIKERFSKSYRLPHLDLSLRQFRTRREAKVLQKLETLNFPAPRLHSFSDKRMSIVMDFIPGEKLKDVLQQGNDYPQFAVQMGLRIGELHNHNIIHGDLTTSNMILNNETLNVIDFGLSSFSEKVEDKAVDLFLFERALDATHHDQPDLFKQSLEGYKKSNPESIDILTRLEAVRKRGRNKTR